FAVRTQRRVVLVMGMPQMLAMSVAEVQVILAHELAHFRSGDTTLTVFLFRLAETARQNAAELRRTRYWWLDPVYWYFVLYQQLFQWTSAPWRRSHELIADQASAAAFGGELAADTLLKDWFIECQFDESLDEFIRRGIRDQSVYEFFMSRLQDFTPESHAYLERRLADLERSAWWADQPTMKQRLKCMRSFPELTPVDTRAAIDLISESQLMRIERELSEKLLAQRRHANPLPSE
ncbi:MAG: M48 family metalloprotease, partial [Planctomycetales bacterium]|nr:M48 family metalloprotease [Planctomycetales bacterium]